jgi:membrane protease YdiL (CAAX protease family)
LWPIKQGKYKCALISPINRKEKPDEAGTNEGLPQANSVSKRPYSVTNNREQSAMEWLKNIYQKCTYVILSIIVIIIVGLWILFIYLFNQIIGSYVIASLIILISVFLRRFKYFGFKAENLLKELLYGLPIILGSIYVLLFSYFSIRNSELITPWAYRIITFIFQMLSIGLFEEVLCRGIIFNILRNKLKNKKGGTLFAIIISSSIF